MIWYDMIWYDLTWCDMMWYDMTWYDMIWYDMIWYDMIWFLLNLMTFTNFNYHFHDYWYDIVKWWKLKINCASTHTSFAAFYSH